jgi:hypothetical protein
MCSLIVCDDMDTLRNKANDNYPELYASNPLHRFDSLFSVVTEDATFTAIGLSQTLVVGVDETCARFTRW